MSPQITIVSNIYAAFGRGDVPGILAQLAEDVEWEYGPASTDTGLPWLQPRRTRAAVGEFFGVLGRELEVRRFAPTQLLENGQTVVALIDIELLVKRTGRTIREFDEVHLWHFGADGRVARFRHAVDTLQHFRAWQS